MLLAASASAADPISVRILSSVIRYVETTDAGGFGRELQFDRLANYA
jgi:hypothetical protein